MLRINMWKMLGRNLTSESIICSIPDITKGIICMCVRMYISCICNLQVFKFFGDNDNMPSNELASHPE